MSEDERRNIALLQRLASDTRPPQDDPIPWPETNNFVNDFNTPGLFSMAFPYLFPYGRGDPTNRDRFAAVTKNNCGKHLIKYAVNIKKVQEILLLDENLSTEERINVNKLYKTNEPEFIYPFVKHERFIHFLQNTVERHRAFSQRGFWLNRNSEFANMDENEMKTVISQGGEDLRKLLGSMQSYNANINGSPQYLYQKRKLLENLIEQHGLCTMWFTLSMADNHWNDMFTALNRDSLGNCQPFPTFSTVQDEASWKRRFVRDNPHFVDAYFHFKVKFLFETIFKKNGIEVEWLWFRVEYQARGAPHIHGCLKIKHSPNLQSLGNKVFKGRLASLILFHFGKDQREDDFDPSDCQFDSFEKIEKLKELKLINHILKMKYDNYTMTSMRGNKVKKL